MFTFCTQWTFLPNSLDVPSLCLRILPNSNSYFRFNSKVISSKTSLLTTLSPRVDLVPIVCLLIQQASCCIAENDLELLILLPPPTECWDYRAIPPHEVSTGLDQTQGFRQGMHSASWATFLATTLLSSMSYLTKCFQNANIFIYFICCVVHNPWHIKGTECQVDHIAQHELVLFT